jgi:hypothetical protein
MTPKQMGRLADECRALKAKYDREGYSLPLYVERERLHHLVRWAERDHPGEARLGGLSDLLREIR